MTISYKFVLDGQVFQCATWEHLENLENYHDIVSIDCSENFLVVLPTLPISLIHLNCSDNKLTVIPTLPSLLEYLCCSYNLLSVVPTLPLRLTHLYCSNNKLTVLPTLPNSVSSLYCSNNLLAFLPKFRDSLEYNYYDNNPVDTFIKEKCGGDLEIYYYDTEIYATKLVRWYLNCRENPTFKFCRDRLNRDYDNLMEEDTGGIMT